MIRLKQQMKTLCLCSAAALVTLLMAPGAAANGDTAALRAAALDTLADMVLSDKDVDETLRDEAAALLGRYGGPAYSAVLVQRIETAPSRAAAVIAIRALGELGDEAQIPTLRTLFMAPEVHETPEDLRWSVAAAAGDALLKCGKAGRDVVLEAAGGSDAEVRRRAIQALAKVRDLATPEFFAGFAHDRDRWVRYETAVILGTLDDATAIPTLQEILDDAEADVRLEAARSLARLGDASGIKLLRGLARSNPDDGLALRLLARLDPVEHLPALLTHLKQSVSEEELDDVAALLSACDRADVVPPLIDACRGNKAPARANAAALLARLKEREATDALAELLQDNSWDVRTQAARALGVIGNKDALPALERLAQQLARRSHDPQTADTREACAIALARLGKQDAAVQLCLVELGETQRLDVPPEVAAQVGGETIERVLIESIRSPDPGRRVEHLLDELRALELIGSRAAAPAIEALLRERPYARMHAINLPEVWAGLLDALAACGGPAATQPVAGYAENETPLVRLAACRGILRLTTENTTRDSNIP